MMIKFLKKKAWKCLRERKVVEIGLLRLVTLPQVTVEAVKAMGIGLNRPYTLPQVITEVMDVGQV